MSLRTNLGNVAVPIDVHRTLGGHLIYLGNLPGQPSYLEPSLGQLLARLLDDIEAGPWACDECDRWIPCRQHPEAPIHLSYAGAVGAA